MASKKITELNAANNVTGTDLLLTVVNPSGVAATRKITVGNFFGNVSTNVVINSTTTLNANTNANNVNISSTANINSLIVNSSIVTNNLIIPQKSTPANSTALTISSGSIFHDTQYLYVATSNNVVKRVSLSVF